MEIPSSSGHGSMEDAAAEEAHTEAGPRSVRTSEHATAPFSRLEEFAAHLSASHASLTALVPVHSVMHVAEVGDASTISFKASQGVAYTPYTNEDFHTWPRGTAWRDGTAEFICVGLHAGANTYQVDRSSAGRIQQSGRVVNNAGIFRAWRCGGDMTCAVPLVAKVQECPPGSAPELVASMVREARTHAALSKRSRLLVPHVDWTVLSFTAASADEVTDNEALLQSNALTLNGWSGRGGARVVIFMHEAVDTLAAWIEKPPMAATGTADAQRLQLAVATTACIAELHALKFAQGDLKPDNMLIGSAYTVMVADLGFAHKTDTVADARGVSTSSEMVAVGHGSAYLAPEAAGGYISSDGLVACDMFGLGITLMQLLTGLSVTNLARNGAVHEDIRTGLLSALRDKDLAVALRELIAACVCDVPSQRPSASSLLFALRCEYELTRASIRRSAPRIDASMQIVMVYTEDELPEVPAPCGCSVNVDNAAAWTQLAAVLDEHEVIQIVDPHGGAFATMNAFQMCMCALWWNPNSSEAWALAALLRWIDATESFFQLWPPSAATKQAWEEILADTVLPQPPISSSLCSETKLPPLPLRSAIESCIARIPALTVSARTAACHMHFLERLLLAPASRASQVYAARESHTATTMDMDAVTAPVERPGWTLHALALYDQLTRPAHLNRVLLLGSMDNDVWSDRTAALLLSEIYRVARLEENVDGAPVAQHVLLHGLQRRLGLAFGDMLSSVLSANDAADVHRVAASALASGHVSCVLTTAIDARLDGALADEYPRMLTVHLTGNVDEDAALLASIQDTIDASLIHADAIRDAAHTQVIPPYQRITLIVPTWRSFASLRAFPSLLAPGRFSFVFKLRGHMKCQEELSLCMCDVRDVLELPTCAVETLRIVLRRAHLIAIGLGMDELSTRTDTYFSSSGSERIAQVTLLVSDGGALPRFFAQMAADHGFAGRDNFQVLLLPDSVADIEYTRSAWTARTEALRGWASSNLTPGWASEVLRDLQHKAAMEAATARVLVSRERVQTLVFPPHVVHEIAPASRDAHLVPKRTRQHAYAEALLAAMIAVERRPVSPARQLEERCHSDAMLVPLQAPLGRVLAALQAVQQMTVAAVPEEEKDLEATAESAANRNASRPLRDAWMAFAVLAAALASVGMDAAALEVLQTSRLCARAAGHTHISDRLHASGLRFKATENAMNATEPFHAAGATASTVPKREFVVAPVNLDNSEDMPVDMTLHTLLTGCIHRAMLVADGMTVGPNVLLNSRRFIMDVLTSPGTGGSARRQLNTEYLDFLRPMLPNMYDSVDMTKHPDPLARLRDLYKNNSAFLALDLDLVILRQICNYYQRNPGRVLLFDAAAVANRYTAHVLALFKHPSRVAATLGISATPGLAAAFHSVSMFAQAYVACNRKSGTIARTQLYHFVGLMLQELISEATFTSRYDAALSYLGSIRELDNVLLTRTQLLQRPWEHARVLRMVIDAPYRCNVAFQHGLPLLADDADTPLLQIARLAFVLCSESTASAHAGRESDTTHSQVALDALADVNHVRIAEDALVVESVQLEHVSHLSIARVQRLRGSEACISFRHACSRAHATFVMCHKRAALMLDHARLRPSPLQRALSGSMMPPRSAPLRRTVSSMASTSASRSPVALFRTQSSSTPKLRPTMSRSMSTQSASSNAGDNTQALLENLLATAEVYASALRKHWQGGMSAPLPVIDTVTLMTLDDSTVPDSLRQLTDDMINVLFDEGGVAVQLVPDTQRCARSVTPRSSVSFPGIIMVANTGVGGDSAAGMAVTPVRAPRSPLSMLSQSLEATPLSLSTPALGPVQAPQQASSMLVSLLLVTSDANALLKWERRATDTEAGKTLAALRLRCSVGTLLEEVVAAALSCAVRTADGDALTLSNVDDHLVMLRPADLSPVEGSLSCAHHHELVHAALVNVSVALTSGASPSQRASSFGRSASMHATWQLQAPADAELEHAALMPVASRDVPGLIMDAIIVDDQTIVAITLARYRGLLPPMEDLSLMRMPSGSGADVDNGSGGLQVHDY